MSKFDGPWDQNYQIVCAKLRQMSVKRTSHAEAPKIKRVGNPDNRHIVIRALESYHETRFSMIVALTLEDQGHSAWAKSRYQDIIAGLEKEHQVVLFCREKISSIQWSCGHYDDAENLCRDVIRMQTALPGRSHVLTLQSIGTLALILLAQGKSQEAYLTLRDVLEDETEDPYQDIARVRLVSILATVLRDLGFIDLSLLLTRSVFTACGALLDSDHPFTLARASDLAEILARKGHVHFAEEVDRHVLGRLLKASGIKHPEYLNTASQLANHLRFQGRYKEAIDLFESTLRAQETQVGSSNPSTVATRCGLAATHALQGHLDESENLLRQNVGSTGSAYDRFWTAEALQCLREFKKSTLQDPGCENDQSRNPSKLQDFFKKPIRARYSGFAMYENIADTLNGTKRENCRLHFAAMSSNDEAFAAALDQGANVRLIGGFCGNALHAACFSGNQRMVRRLLQLGVNSDAQGGIFGTPLRAASFSGHTDIVELLLKAGADPNTKTKLGESALQAALATNRLAVAQILLSAGADYNGADSFYGTPLHEASMAGQQDMVRTLLDFGADPNIYGGFFGTALRAAAWKGDSSIVECLLKKGARLDTRFEGRTAFSLAAANENEEVVKILVTEHAHRTNSSDSEYMSISIKEPRMMTDDSLKMSKNQDPTYNGSKPTKKKRKQIKKVINRYVSAQIGYLRKI